MPVLVGKPGAADFKFTVNDNLLGQTSVDCTGTSGMAYVDHIGPFLILLDGVTLKMCVAALTNIADSSTLAVTLVTLTFGTAPAATQFVDAYYYYPVDSKASILFGDSISTELYEVNPAGVGARVQGFNGYIPRGIGGHQIIFNTSSNVILQKPPGAGAWTTFGTVTPLAAGHDLLEANVRQKVVKLYPFNGGVVAVALLDTDRLKGKLYLIRKGDVVDATSWTIGTGATTATLRAKFWTDGSRNLIVVTQTDLTWINLLDTSGMNLKHAQIPLPGAATLNVLTLPTILDIGVSRDKAVILTTNQAIVTLLLTASEQIKVLYTQQINGDITDVTDLTALTGTDRRLYKLKVECLCETINKLVCYSATLNCVIIQRASATCGGAMDWTTIS